MNVAERVVETLVASGVEHVFGVPGDTSIALYDAFCRAQARLRHVMARDERGAAFMADVYARLSGRVGVCEGPSGGGATYMVPGLAEAQGSSIPLLALITDNPLSYAHQGALTDVDQQTLFRAVSKWTARVEQGELAEHMLRRALRLATSGRPGVAQLTLPKDVLSQEAGGAAPRAQGEVPRERPDAGAVERAAELLRAARRPVAVAGGGVHSARAYAELVALAERLAMPVATTINGKGAVAETHALALGVVGANGGRDYANAWVREADLVFFIGTKANYVDTANWTVPPRDGERTILQLDVDPAEVGNNYPVAVGLVGDARLGLQDLCEALGPLHREQERAGVAAEIARRARGFWQGFERAAAEEGSPVRPERVIRVLAAALPAEHVIVADPGTPTPYVAAMFRVGRAGRTVVIPRAHGGLGYAIPGVVGARLARPDSAVVGLVGDGSFTMSAGELATVRRIGGRVVLIHFNNGCFGWIKMLQHRECQGRYFGVDFPEGIDYVRVVEGFGLRAWRVERGDEFPGALRQALATGEPAFIDVLTPPEHVVVPPVAAWRAERG